tara:strand:- start:123 stop:503 length:381 start_codon:yes stop_codon:yes gene_type:complete
MPNYVQDPNDSSKQIPGPKTKQHYDRVTELAAFSGSYKTPHYIYCSEAVSAGFGFYFGSNSDFSASAASEGNNPSSVLSGSSHYQSFNKLPAGVHHLHPIAVSGSDADVAKIRFVYKGGLDGMGRF